MKLKFLVLIATFLSLLLLIPHSSDASPVGICYGRVADNLLPATDVVNLVKSNGITTVRVFNADPETLRAFAGSDVSLMIGVPNEALPLIAAGTAESALQWLQWNIFAHISSDQIRYLAVGNEILMKDSFYTPHLVPAIVNLHQALQLVNLAEKIKLSSAHAATILSNSYPPSAGSFDPQFKPIMAQLLQFLSDSGSALMINVYPFFSYTNNPQYVSLDYALFRSPTTEYDNNLAYDNLFDATVDSFVAAMEREGFSGIPVVVTETGWPSSGGGAASAENALAYNGNVLRRALNNVGTPKRPGVGIEVFLFALFDEDKKSGEEVEKHFGIFDSNGHKAYDLNFN